jgi:hypothetical protein
MATQDDIRAARRHKILQKRGTQLGYNALAASGGNDYIEARLTRFPCETDTSWAGSSALGRLSNGAGVLGRKDRAYCINYARRIVTKINQYVFGADIVRNGIDPVFEQDATKTGLSIGNLMQEASSAVTFGQWCWISVDRAAMAMDPAGNSLPDTAPG